MSTPAHPTVPKSPDAKPPAAKPSAASRYLFLFLLGLVIGVIAVVMLLRTFEGRKTWEDHYSYAAMNLMQAHVAQLGASAQANRCAATDTLPHLQALRTVANDIEPALVELRDDKRFVAHAGQLRATLDAALAAPPLSCAAVGSTLGNIGEACKACHQDFRG